MFLMECIDFSKAFHKYLLVVWQCEREVLCCIKFGAGAFTASAPIAKSVAIQL